MNRHPAYLMLGVAAASLFSSVALAAEPDWRGEAIAMLKRDFQSMGQASYERIHEDDLQALCNKYSNTPPEKAAAKMMAAQLKTVKYPADGQLMGDWKVGEKIAQSGKGFTWTDEPGIPVGGNCYNCHQISPKEISYGTLGPSLFNFGKLRGGPTPEMQKYAYSKIYNSKSYNTCSNMPRFGHVGALNEGQIKDLVALLLDPESPVNK
ncbi:MAG: sulfur oxidation c-type cytochrome SoxX [Sulfuricella sp.]|nr:sulfur oxidation c-type cytochrome SoxX [Sulfuricella sp.]